jgi:hypothetical protein
LHILADVADNEPKLFQDALEPILIDLNTFLHYESITTK